MAELFFEGPRRRLAPGLAIGALVLMIVAGVVTVALPLRCIPGLLGDVVCPPSGPSAALAKTSAATAPAAAVSALSMTAPTLEPALLAARPSAYGLVAATFEQLHADPAIPATSAATSTAAPDAAAANPRPAVSTQSGGWAGAPTVRLVSTTVIRPGPTEITPPATIEPVAEPAPGPVPLAIAAAEPATDSAPPPSDTAQLPASDAGAPAPIPAPPPVRVAEASGFPAVQPLEAPKVAVAATAAPKPASSDASAKGALPKSGTLLVGGSGVTARSGPSRSKGRLFALDPGQKVRVLGDTRGWYHISDARGRNGWVYSDFLAKAP